MANYKCPTLGDCERANTGEIFERSPGEDLHCPDCGTLLEPQIVRAPTGGARKPVVIAAVAGIVALAIVGGGAGIYYKKTHAAPAAVADSAAQAQASSDKAPAATDTAATSASDVQPTADNREGGIAPSAGEIDAQRKAGDAKLAHGDAVGAEAASNDAATKEMIKVAIADMAQGKLDHADKELDDAAARDPKQPLVYYNRAVLRLKQGRTDDALKQFEASFLNGFSYFDAMAKDPDLAGIRSDPRFAALVQKYRPATM
ncbi:tetratricopeptide repeat protein [Paraburkholderia sp.]|uniref:TPR end-of-group domain-containing protein n=1 Tax=Paraburkholderia sp. TaxID=1926495 RepID=UPI0025F8102F|nr:tetratricopeptide repeat protein [Paraburkholderia sp.]